MTLRAPPRETGQAETIDTDSALKHSPSGILFLNKKRYAAGLVWLVADTDTAPDLIKQRTARLGADFCCTREGSTLQQGFGFLRLGHRTGMASAASMAADAVIGEWHGVFAVDNGWWYLAVHGDAIAPDGDQMFESEEEAYNAFLRKTESHKWPRSYAPASWKLPNTNGELALDKLLEGDGTFAYLRATNLTAFFGGARRKKVFLASAAFFVLIVLGLTTLIALVADQTAGKKSPDSFPVALDAPDIIKPPPPLPEKDQALRATFVTLNAPLPSGILAACLRSLDTLVRPVPGWEPSEAGCDTGQAIVQWKQKSGSLQAIESIREDFPEEARLTYSGSGALLAAIPHRKLDILSQNFMVLPKADAILLLERTFSTYGQIQIRYVAPKALPKAAPKPPANKKPAPAAKNKPPEKPPVLTMSLSGLSPPARLQSAFDLPGLTLQNVKWDIKTRLWTYQAEMLVESEALNDTAPAR